MCARYWAPLTIAFVSDSHIGGCFRTSILRLEGTFMGVTFGFLILQLLFVANIHQLLAIALLTIWVFFCGYYRSNPSRGYAGLVAAFTAALIVSGFDPENSKNISVEKYSLHRIEQTFLGIVLLLVVLQFLSPNTARSLLHLEISQSLQMMSDLFSDAFSGFENIINRSISSPDGSYEIKTDNELFDEKSSESEKFENGANQEKFAVLEIVSLTDMNKMLKKSKFRFKRMFDNQKILIAAAVFEPKLWHSQYLDSDVYQEIHSIQFWILRRICQIQFCVQSLLEIEHQQRININNSNSNQISFLGDIKPFQFYLHEFRICHKIIMKAFQHCIRNIHQKSEGNSATFTADDILSELQFRIEQHWKSHEKYLLKYMSFNRDDCQQRLQTRVLTNSAAMIIMALRFSLNNLMLQLSQIVHCLLQLSS